MTADASAGKTPPPVVTSLTGDDGSDSTDADLGALIAMGKEANAGSPEVASTPPAAPSPPAGATTTPPTAAASVAASDTARTILIHFLEDGFTAWGQVWYRGQEVEIAVPSKHYDLTKGIDGVSWLDDLLGPQNEMRQARRWGRVMFREGPWPGDPWNDATAQQAEAARRRQPPTLAIPAGVGTLR